MEKYAMKNKSRGIIAYAQFQSMNGRDKFLRAINKTAWCMRICTKRHDYKYLKKKWPEVAKGPEPTVIIWQNLQVGAFSRFIRTLFVALVTLVLLAISMMGIVVSKYYQDTEGALYDVSQCGTAGELATKETVMQDLAKPVDRQVGLLNCYCYSQLIKIGLNVRTIQFPPNNEMLCNAWLTGYGISNAIV
jgi:hypothetical protein